MNTIVFPFPFAFLPEKLPSHRTLPKSSPLSQPGNSMRKSIGQKCHGTGGGVLLFFSSFSLHHFLLEFHFRGVGFPLFFVLAPRPDFLCVLLILLAILPSLHSRGRCCGSVRQNGRKRLLSLCYYLRPKSPIPALPMHRFERGNGQGRKEKRRFGIAHTFTSFHHFHHRFMSTLLAVCGKPA